MQKIKTVLKKTAESSLEFVKPLGSVVSVDSVVSQVKGKPQVNVEPKNNDVGTYLKNVGDPNVNPEEVQKKDAQKAAAKIQDYRKSLQLNDSTVSHLRIPDLKEYRKAKKGIYYDLLQQKEDEERQKNAAQGNEALVIPTSKPARGSLTGKIKHQEATSIESKQNTKAQ